MEVKNSGNLPDTLIPELLGAYVEDYSFDIDYVVLDIDESSFFSITLTMPFIASGDRIDFEVGSSSGNTDNAELTIIAEDHHNISCEYPDSLSAAPGDSFSIAPTTTLKTRHCRSTTISA